MEPAGLGRERFPGLLFILTLGCPQHYSVTKVSSQCSGRSKWVLHHLDLCSQPIPDVTEPLHPLGKRIFFISGSLIFTALISHQKNIFSKVGPLLELFFL